MASRSTLKLGADTPAIKGNVMVNSSVCQELGRAANVARVLVGMPLDPDPLPPLLDATLAGMAVTGFVLSGIESTSMAARMPSHGGAGKEVEASGNGPDPDEAPHLQTLASTRPSILQLVTVLGYSPLI